MHEARSESPDLICHRRIGGRQRWQGRQPSWVRGESVILLKWRKCPPDFRVQRKSSLSNGLGPAIFQWSREGGGEETSLSEPSPRRERVAGLRHSTTTLYRLCLSSDPSINVFFSLLKSHSAYIFPLFFFFPLFVIFPRQKRIKYQLGFHRGVSGCTGINLSLCSQQRKRGSFLSASMDSPSLQSLCGLSPPSSLSLISASLLYLGIGFLFLIGGMFLWDCEFRLNGSMGSSLLEVSLGHM